MGRGRAKAKQTKVARQLKYNSGGTDLDRLRAELISPSVTNHDAHDQANEVDEDEAYSDYSTWDDDEDEDG
jgi:hypothetical protein